MISNVKSTDGIGTNVLKKRIHEGSESIMFSVLQETQYMYPYKSAVREIVSNSIDSVNERNNSLKILNGDIEVEDIYIVKEGTEFKDSVFKPEYYNKKWLSNNDMITILYVEDYNGTRDRIKFIDNGVGLGGSRLLSYFNLGFSSKRLSKSQLGNFGLGAKSLLATGVDYYTVTSRYNGRMYSFNVYKDHTVPVIGKFNDDGTINNIEIFDDNGEDVEIFYRTTKEKNGVIVEAEVKKHRKQDYVNGIKNQLGFIENIEFKMADSHNASGYNVNITNEVLFSNGRIIVGDTNYYAVPQILLTPGENSNIRINYGTISFDELEMKRYSGNVCFVMNINEVDVTPSREHVIWNNRTRDAIKKMFIEAQETVSGFIEDKVSGAKTLPQHYALFEGFKSKTSSDGLSELYKIVDVAELDSVYRGFSLVKAAKQIDTKGLDKSFIFTSTPFKQYYANRVNDTVYSSALTKSGIGDLYRNSDTVVYIGNTKYKNLAKYVNVEFPTNNSDSIKIIYMKPDLYDEYIAKIEKSKKEKGNLNDLVDKAYINKRFSDVLIYEVIRYAQNHPSKVLLEADIDKTKLSNIEKEEEKSKQDRYMTPAERAKLEGKVIGYYHEGTKHSYRKYYNEETLKNEETTPLIYNLSDDFFGDLFSGSQYTSFSSRSGNRNNFNIIGFANENFKRFYKIPEVKLLSDALYTIRFGVLKFTELGVLLLDSKSKNYINNNWTNFKTNDSLLSGAFKFLHNVHATTDIEHSDHKDRVAGIVDNYRKKQKKYLENEK